MGVLTGQVMVRSMAGALVATPNAVTVHEPVRPEAWPLKLIVPLPFLQVGAWVPARRQTLAVLEAVSTLAVTTMSPGPLLPKAIERALPPEAAGESSWRLENRIVAVGEVGMGVGLGDGDAVGVTLGSSVGVSVGGWVVPPGRVGVGLAPATRVGVGEAPLVPPRGMSRTAAPKPISRARTTARTIATRRQPSSVTSTLLLGTWGGHTEDSEPRPPARGRRRGSPRLYSPPHGAAPWPHGRGVAQLGSAHRSGR